MRRTLIVLVTLLLFNIASAADLEGGVDVDPELEGTPFAAITHSTPSTDFEQWNISITLTDSAVSNNTTFTLTTQICNNEGICMPPEVRDLSSDDNTIFTGNVTAIEDHSYVNWRLQTTYNDDNESQEKFPESGWYKTWSDCWYNDGEWGGGACLDEVSKLPAEEDSLSAIPAIMTITIIGIAAIIRYE